MNDTYILAFETSCDETSVAVLKNGTELLSNVIASQVNSHKRFGGVVPEVASRHHVEQITACIDEALEQAGITAKELSAVAVTEGPGLVGALLVGIMAAKTFAWANKLPLIPVNHIAGHLMAAALVDTIEYPAMALLVSGGHTELVYVESEGNYKKIGETRDDAAGEAYDKVGRVMGLTYPSGKEIDELAHKGEDTYAFPRAMLTAADAKQQGQDLVATDLENLAASFQAAVVDVLIAKTKRALEQYPAKTLIVGGGVSANQGLRERLATDMKDIKVILPPLRLCGDNAGMIAAAATIEMERENFTDLSLNARPSLVFGDI